LRVGWDAETLLAATVLTAAAAAAKERANALVRWSAFVPVLEPDVVPRPGSPASVAIAVIAPEDSVGPGEPPPQKKPEVVRARVPTDTRKAGPEVLPPHAKVSASYLGPMLAKGRAQAEGFD
jgi:hypothetical protein